MEREHFDSDEEMYMYWWLEELQKEGNKIQFATGVRSSRYNCLIFREGFL